MVSLAATGWWFRVPLENWLQGKIASVQVSAAPKPKPDLVTYQGLVKDLERWRVDLSKRYETGSKADRLLVEQDARLILEQALPALMRCWLGTPWDFNGTAEFPGEKQVACGYFVATVLRDAGFRLDRYRLAQQPSENILRTFLEKESCQLTVGQKYEAFATGLENAEPGIYVVGLDTHVAFVVVGETGFRFIHSSGSRPWCVVDESKDEAVVLRNSNWRMLGNLTGDAGVLRRWLKGDKLTVKET